MALVRSQALTFSTGTATDTAKALETQCARLYSCVHCNLKLRVTIQPLARFTKFTQHGRSTVQLERGRNRVRAYPRLRVGQRTSSKRRQSELDDTIICQYPNPHSALATVALRNLTIALSVLTTDSDLK
jgi:hypothetical protein